MILRPLAPNQTEIYLKEADTQVFFSYSTPVAARVKGMHYQTAEKFSNTTTKHMRAWLGGALQFADTMPQSFFDNLLSVQLNDETAQTG